MKIKQLLLCTLIVCAGTTSFAQRERNSFLGLSAGINNPAGMIGMRFDTRIAPKLMGTVNLGLGWGVKTSLGVVYQPKQGSGWCPFISISHTTGADSIVSKLQVQQASAVVMKDVAADFKPINTLNLGFERQWIGSKGNRFFLTLGYSFALHNGDVYELYNKAEPLTKASALGLKLQSPGGIMVGLGYSFGL